MVPPGYFFSFFMGSEANNSGLLLDIRGPALLVLALSHNACGGGGWSSEKDDVLLGHVLRDGVGRGRVLQCALAGLFGDAGAVRGLGVGVAVRRDCRIWVVELERTHRSLHS